MSFWNKKRQEVTAAARGHNVYVAPQGDDWVVRLSGRFLIQSDAVLVARAIASQLGVESEIRGEGGRIREKDSHGHDDPNTPG